MSPLRPVHVLVAAAGLAGCEPTAPAARAVVADPAILQGALADWQEGPTDGRLCLDPRVLPAPGDATAARWADEVLAVLLTDTLVALDTTAAPRHDVRQRACAPTRVHPRLALGVPRRRGDSADVETLEFPTTAAETWRGRRLPAVLARLGVRWYVVRHPGDRFVASTVAE